MTSSAQWLERTLDDSANRRISIPEAFLATDAILKIYSNIAQGIVVYNKTIENNVMKEIPFMATEEILMHAVLNGGDRQELHEIIRKYSMEAGKQVKEFGKKNDLIDRIVNDSKLGLSINDINNILKPEHLCGRAPNQVKDFIEEQVKPTIEKNKEWIKHFDNKLEI